MRVIDGIMSILGLLLAIALMAIFGASMVALTVAASLW